MCNRSLTILNQCIDVYLVNRNTEYDKIWIQRILQTIEAWGWALNLSGKKVFSLQKAFKHPRGWNYYQKLTEHASILQIYGMQNKELAVLNYSLGYAKKGYDHRVWESTGYQSWERVS